MATEFVDKRRSRGPDRFVHMQGVISLSFQSIRWLAICLPALTVAIFEYFRHQWLEPLLPPLTGNLVTAAIVAVAVYGFVQFFIDLIRRSAQELSRVREQAAVMHERQRIAREMHDSVAQTLFYLTVKLREVDGLVVAGQNDQAHRQMQTIAGHLKETYQSVRHVIADLKQHGEPPDFHLAIRWAAEQAAERLGLRVEVDAAEVPSLSADAQQQALSIIQEALTNAQRHGSASRVTVRCRRSGEGLMLEIADDGGGFDPDRLAGEGGYGISIMTERAHMIGGHLQVASSPGQGTTVRLRLPEVVG